MDKPFLTHGEYLGKSYVGIVGNSDSHIISIYLLDEIRSESDRQQFLALGHLWWTETNHQIPINIALGESWSKFSYSMKSFITKDFKITSGPKTSLDDIIVRKPKRRLITLVRKG